MSHHQTAAPGLFAALSRHPERLRTCAAAAIVSGALLFVVASVATAGANPVRPPAADAAVPSAAPSDVNLDQIVPAFESVSPIAPSAAKLVRPAKQAPTDSAAISGLAANGIPTVALNAYRVAAARMDNADPGCGIDWALLAGIGREESDHGQFAGAVLHADGVSTPRIIGIALNGHGTALIRDTDHGRLDGDTVYDHAVGPMQFIPSTWALYGTDANGDGIADPFNINDAALTAARYLCAAGGDLRAHAGQVAAVLAYNHSAQYLTQVLALADAYRRGISISGLPVGNTTGQLPAVATHGPPPAANPGAPTANQPSHAPAKPAGSSASAAGATPATSAANTPASSAPPTTAGPQPTSSGTPTPTPSPTCKLQDLLNPGKCAIP